MVINMFFGLDKIFLYKIGGALVATLMVTGIYFVWKHNVEKTALLEYNVHQLQQTLQDQQRFIQRQSEIAEQQRQAALELAEHSRTLQAQINDINAMINATPDVPAPDIIQQTIERLRTRQ